MSPTCRRHDADIAKCRQILADIACRCDTEEAPTYPIYINYYDKYKSAQTYGYLSYHRVFVFELKQQSRNYRVADTTQNVAIWATKTTRRHPTYGAKAIVG
jgi:hypothetical protein